MYPRQVLYQLTYIPSAAGAFKKDVESRSFLFLSSVEENTFSIENYLLDFPKGFLF